jgi:transcriptional regulator with XRE-family HTH domain
MDQPLEDTAAGLDERVRRRTGHLGQQVRRLRGERSLTLRELAARAGLASSTISKVENGLMSPTYDNIVRLALGLDVDVEMLFNEKATSMQAGRRSVTRAGEGVVVRAENYSYEMLSTDIAHKKFVPIVATLLPSRTEEAAKFLRHSGEEFVYVLTGRITILTSLYTPLQLDPGDSCYFDSAMGHVLVAANGGTATVLWVASIEPNLLSQPD